VPYSIGAESVLCNGWHINCQLIQSQETLIRMSQTLPLLDRVVPESQQCPSTKSLAFCFQRGFLTAKSRYRLSGSNLLQQTAIFFNAYLFPVRLLMNTDQLPAPLNLRPNGERRSMCLHFDSTVLLKCNHLHMFYTITFCTVIVNTVKSP